MANSCGIGIHQDIDLHTISPLILAAKAAAKKEDNLNSWQAMNGPYNKEYWKAAQTRLKQWKGSKHGQWYLTLMTL